MILYLCSLIGPFPSLHVEDIMFEQLFGLAVLLFIFLLAAKAIAFVLGLALWQVAATAVIIVAAVVLLVIVGSL